jgi:hypothetical protein
MKQKPRPSGRVPASPFIQFEAYKFSVERYLRLRIRLRPKGYGGQEFYVGSAGTCPQPSPYHLSQKEKRTARAIFFRFSFLSSGFRRVSHQAFTP